MPELKAELDKALLDQLQIFQKKSLLKDIEEEKEGENQVKDFEEDRKDEMHNKDLEEDEVVEGQAADENLFQKVE